MSGWTGDDYLAVALGLGALVPLSLAALTDGLMRVIRHRRLDGSWGCVAIVIGLWLGIAGMVVAFR